MSNFNPEELAWVPGIRKDRRFVVILTRWKPTKLQHRRIVVSSSDSYDEAIFKAQQLNDARRNQGSHWAEDNPLSHAPGVEWWRP